MRSLAYVLLVFTLATACKPRENSGLQQTAAAIPLDGKSTAELYRFETKGSGTFKTSYMYEAGKGYLLFANTTSNFAIIKLDHGVQHIQYGQKPDNDVYQHMTPVVPDTTKIKLYRQYEKGYVPTYAKIDDEQTPLVAAVMSADLRHIAVSTRYNTYLVSWEKPYFTGARSVKKIIEEGAQLLSFSPDGKYLGMSFNGDNRIEYYDLAADGIKEFQGNQVSRTDISDPFISIGWIIENKGLGMYAISSKSINIAFVKKQIDPSNAGVAIPTYARYELGNLEHFVTGSVSQSGEFATVVYHKGDNQRDKDGNKKAAGYYLRFFKPQIIRIPGEYHGSRSGELTVIRPPAIELKLDTDIYYPFKTMTTKPTHIHLGNITKPTSEILLREKTTYRDVTMIGSDGNSDFPNFWSIRVRNRPLIIKQNWATSFFGEDRLTKNETPWKFTENVKKYPAYPANDNKGAIDIRWSAPLSDNPSYQLLMDRRGGLFLFDLFP